MATAPNKKASDIDRIVPVEYDRIIVFFKDGTKIETTEIDFLPDGDLDFGYIFGQ